MKKKILLACFEVPGWGGASTSAYKLFENLLADGLTVDFLNLIGQADAPRFGELFGDRLGNPKQLPRVRNHFLERPTYEPHAGLGDLIEEIAPDLIVGVGWIAALLLKRASPARSVIYLTTGCDQMKAYVEKYGADFVSFATHHFDSTIAPFIPSRLEKEAVAKADYIITHSDMNLRSYRYFFRSYTGKIYPRVIWFAEWIHREASEYAVLARPFAERDIDVLFVASDWGRAEKNYRWVKTIAREARDLRIHVIGATNEFLRGVEHHGPIADRHELFSFLGRAKTLVCPSLFDAAPGVLFEGAALGCNLVASENCGNWSLCNESLVVRPFSCRGFLDKIRLSLTQKFPDHIERFLHSGSYSDLVETLSVF